MAISANNNKRFGALPLPIEMDSHAAEGEIMVGRTTGHMYVRSGGVNKSKTVELENWINAYRPNALNWIRNGGGDTLEEELVKEDWVLNTDKAVSNGLTVVEDSNKHFKFIRADFHTHAETGRWSLLANKMYTYFNFKALKVGIKLCLSVTLRTNNNAKITFLVQRLDGSANILGFPQVQSTSEFTRYELVTTLKDGANEPVLYIIADKESTILDIKDIQLEPGDRASAHRASIFDAMRRMEWLDDKNKGDLEKKIQQAISECKNYTNSEITKLDNKIQTALRNAITECKSYTDSKHAQINSRVDREIAEIHKSLRNERAHIILGNSDWTSYCEKNYGEITYSPEHKGISCKNSPSFFLNKPISINQNSKYYIKVSIKCISGRGVFYCGVQSLKDVNGELIDLSTDSCGSYNYGVAGSNNYQEPGNSYTYSCIYEGYNPLAPQTGQHNKFDPYANYFRLIFLPNFANQEQGVAETIITSVEVFEIPGCLEDAISPVDNSKNGLMTIAQKQKLDGIEDRANRYVHPDNDGSKHVPATGTTSDRKVLTAGKNPGQFAWENLPTDSGTLQGKHANDFVWVNEEKKIIQSATSVANQNMTSQYLQRNNALYTNAINWNMGYSGNTGYLFIKTPIKNGEYFTLNFSVYNFKLGLANISLGGYFIWDNGEYSYHAYSDNSNLTSNEITILSFDSRLVIRIGTSSTLWQWAYLTVDTLTTGWYSPGDDNYLRTAWSTDISPTAIPSNNRLVKTLRVNTYLDAGTLDGLDSSYFAKMLGDHVTTYTNIPNANAANMKLRGNNEDSWIMYDITSPIQNPFGLYYRNTDSTLEVAGQKPLPMNSFAFIGGGALMHYMALSNGDVYHKGKLESSNIQLGEFRIIKNQQEKCLDFLFE